MNDLRHAALRAIAVFCAAQVAWSCIFIRSHTLPSEIDGGSHAVVTATVTAWNILDLMDVQLELRDKLLRRCSSGGLSGVETTLQDREVRVYSLPLFRYYEVKATGLCGGQAVDADEEEDE